ncbi:MAG: hypothetical protein ACRC92_04280 [Peptostreptococcaceae bacterium]
MNEMILDGKYSYNDILNIDYTAGVIYFNDGGSLPFDKINIQHSEREIDGRICFIPLNWMYKAYARPGELMVDHELGKLYLKLLNGTEIQINSEYSYVKESELQSHYVQDGIPPVDKSGYHTVWYQTNANFITPEETLITKIKVQQIVGYTDTKDPIFKWVTILPKINSDAVIVGISTNEVNEKREITLTEYIATNERNISDIEEELRRINTDISKRLQIVEEYQIFTLETGQDTFVMDKDFSDRYMLDVILNGLVLFNDEYTIDIPNKIFTLNTPVKSTSKIRVRGMVVKLLDQKGNEK